MKGLLIAYMLLMVAAVLLIAWQRMDCDKRVTQAVCYGVMVRGGMSPLQARDYCAKEYP